MKKPGNWRNWQPWRIVCPHCRFTGKAGQTAHAFTLIELVPQTRQILAVDGEITKRGTLYVSTDVDTADDGYVDRDPKIKCHNCEKLFDCPKGVLMAWENEEDFIPDWLEFPEWVRCENCGLRSITTEPGSYTCENLDCNHITTVGSAPPVVKPPAKEDYRQAAREKYKYKGKEVKIDLNPHVAQSQDGAYVRAWVWVADEELE